MATFKSVRDIFYYDPVGNSTIVVQGISGGENENLLYYLEVICKNKTIKDVFVPSRNGGVALAVLEEKFTVESIREWQESASKRKFEGVVLTLKMLGEPKGIYLELPKDTTISEEFLSLYFESRKSGGIEETVIDAKLSPSAHNVHAVVRISSDNGVKSILRKSDHKLKGEDVALQPYYPEVHDHIIKASIKESQPYDSSSVQVPSINENMQKEQLSKLEISSPSKAVNSRNYVPSPVRPIHPQQVLHNSMPTSNNYTSSSSPGTYSTPDPAQPSHSSNSNLMVLCDDQELPSATFNTDASARQYVSPFKQQNNNSTVLHAPKEASNWKDPRVVAVKPVQRKTERQSSTGSMDVDKQNCKPKSRGRGKYYKQEEDDDNLPNTVEVGLPSVEIVMLKICHIQDKYQEKYQTDSLKFVLNERTGKVIIRSSTDTEAVQAKLFLHECLHGLIKKEKSLTENRLVLLKREQSKNCLRNICKKQKVRASFVVNEANKSIEWYGFAEGDIEQGVKLLQNEISVQKIQLSPGQERSVNGDAWNDLTLSLSIGTTCIFFDEKSKTIIIESFYGPKVQEVRSKVIDFLKENVPKKSAKVPLEGAKARCFKACMEDQMKQKAVKANGKFDVNEINRSPLKLEIIVEGEESLIDELKKLVHQIWHESIDFDKISSKDEDKWLMLQGLGSQTGSMFIRNFEHQHNCFIEVSKKGEVFIPKPRVIVHDVVNTEQINEQNAEMDICPETDEDESADSLRRGGYDEDIEEERNTFDLYKSGDMNDTSSDSDISDKRWASRRLSRERAFLLQGAMTEDDALMQALKLSQEDQNAQEDRFSYRSSHGYLPPRLQRGHVRNPFSEDSDSDEAQQRSSLRTRSIKIGQINVSLVQGKIAEQRADVLVNVVSPNGSITESVVSKAFVQCGGDRLIQLYQDAVARDGGVSAVISTQQSGRLRCKAVLHVKLQPGAQLCQQILGQVLPDILDECCNNCYTTLALPPLGVGRLYKYQAPDVAQQILRAISLHQQSGLKHITVVIFKGDDKTYKDFDFAFNYFNNSGIQGFNSVQQPSFPHAYLTPSGLSKQNLVQQRPDPRRSAGPLPNYLVARLNQGQGAMMRQNFTPPGLQHSQSLQSPHFAFNTPSATSENRTAVNPVRSKHHSASSSAERRSSGSGRRSGHRGRSGYSSRLRDSADRDYSGGKSHEVLRSMKDTSSKSKHNRKSRFPEDQPADDLNMKVIAANKDICVQTRNSLGNEIKKEFLYEEKLPKNQKISRETKEKIIGVIVKHRIKSFKVKDGYLLKGGKEYVKEALREIMKILLDEKGNPENKRRRREHIKRGTTEYAKVMFEDGPNVPTNWKMYKPETSITDLLSSVAKFFSGRKYDKVSLSSDSRPYSAIIKMINATFDPSKVGQGQDATGLDKFHYSKLFVIKIERIENLELYEKYARHIQILFRRLFLAGEGRYPKISKLPDCHGEVKTKDLVRSALGADLYTELNEVFLFHGTKKENVDVICDGGLDNRLAGDKAMLGQGIYGAECSMKADQYADDKGNRTAGQGEKKKMFLMRMLLGNAFVCKDPNPHKYCRPPCTKCFRDDCNNARHAQKYGHLFDSIIGDNGKLFREFVVYDRFQCYPEYLITYERR